MTPIELLEQSLKCRFPNAKFLMDRPQKITGIWFLGISLNSIPIMVQWKQGKGFGISHPSEKLFGDGADEIYENAEDAYGRIVYLFENLS